MLGAATLDGGAAAFERLAGARVPGGGVHPRMGTHNRLTRLGDGAFLEIIAIDPEAPSPDRSRWYALDDAATMARVEGGVALLTWVVAVDDLDAAIARAAEAGFDAGRPVEQVRDDLAWRIALADDGALVDGGAFPVLIEWPPGADPVSRMADLGLRLERLRLSHPEPARLGAGLRAIGADGLAEIGDGEPRVAATLSIDGRTVEL